MRGAGLTALVVVLLCSASAQSATVVQHRSCVVLSSVTGTCAFSSPNTAGNTLIYITGFENVGNLFTSVSSSDSALNTVSAIDSVIGTAFSGDRIALASWWVTGCTGGSNTVSFSTSVGSATNNFTMVIMEVSGLQASALDVHSIGPFQTTTPNTTAITTTGSADLVIGYGTADPGAGGFALTCSNSGGTACTIPGTNFNLIDAATDGTNSRETIVNQIPTSALVGTYTMQQASNAGGSAKLVGALAFKVQKGSSTLAGSSTMAGPSTRN